MEASFGYWKKTAPDMALCSTTIFPTDVIERLKFRLTEMNL